VFQEEKEASFDTLRHVKKPLFLLFPILLLTITPDALPLVWNRWPPTPLRVALTFDDGPHPIPTIKLCNELAYYHTPATFFIVGSVAQKSPEILQALVGEGHEIASHTWSHPDIRRTSARQMRSELDRTRELIRSVTGRDTTLFRTPGGTEAYLRKHFHVPAGYQLVLWDVHSLDQEGVSANRISARVLSRVRGGDIVLMHNGLDTTLEALNTIIPALKKRGFEFVTVSELLAHKTSLQLASQHTDLVRG
jgi:peptidoglycan/xylan/chitin deacetylase (PgdA/CDA1 family)